MTAGRVGFFERPLGLVLDGLFLYVDAANTNSYPGTGTTWFDISGNNRNGTLTNGPVYSTSNGGIFTFDGINDFVSFNFPFTQSSSAFSYTVTAGARLATTSAARRQLWSSDSGFFDWSFGAGDNTKYMIFTGTTVALGSNQDTDWHIFTAQWSSAFGTRLYLDNVIDINTPQISYESNISPVTHIGSNPASGPPGPFSEYWEGDVAFVLVYNRALSVTENTQNFNYLRSRIGV